MDPEDISDDDAAYFTSAMSECSKKFIVEVESTIEMSEDDALLALLVWCAEELGHTDLLDQLKREEH